MLTFRALATGFFVVEYKKMRHWEIKEKNKRKCNSRMVRQKWEKFASFTDNNLFKGVSELR
jgi:hypothetical protein